MLEQTARDINKLGGFCGKRDLPALTQAAMRQAYGCPQADVMVLFGGSILAGGDVLAQAMQNGAAKKFIIVGGAGHTTQTLRETVHAACPEIETDNEPEAVVFDRYLRSRYGLYADALETQSTNCGNNITYLLDLLERENIPCRSIILCQDATMQRRMGRWGCANTARRGWKSSTMRRTRPKWCCRAASWPTGKPSAACGRWTGM